MSHIQDMRELYAQNRKEVLRILNWTEEQYLNFQFEAAYKYMTEGMNMPYEWQNALTRIPKFWNFWINQWNLRDLHEFLPNAGIIKNQTPETVYRYIHSERYMIASPSNKLFEEAYAIMIGDSFDELKAIAL